MENSKPSTVEESRALLEELRAQRKATKDKFLKIRLERQIDSMVWHIEKLERCQA